MLSKAFTTDVENSYTYSLSYFKSPAYTVKSTSRNSIVQAGNQVIY